MKTTYLTLIALVFSVGSFAQGFTAYSTDNNSRSSSMMVNPANMMNSKSKIDVTIFSINSTASSDYFQWNKSQSNLDKNIKLQNSLNSITNIQGPSFQMKLNPKMSIGLFTNVNIGVASTFDGQLAKNIDDKTMLINNANAHVGAFGWSEVGLSVARTIYDKGSSHFTVGLSLKLLTSLGYAFGDLRNFSADTASASHSGSYHLGGAAEITVPSKFVSVDNRNIKLNFDPQTGVGLDFGISYIWDGRVPTDIKTISDMTNSHTNGAYKLKIDASIVDLGKINLKNSVKRTYAINDVYVDKETLNNIDFQKLQDEFSYTEEKGQESLYLPTRANLAIDYHVYGNFYANVSSTIPLQTKYMAGYSNGYKTSVLFTPRYERNYFGAQMPVGRNIYGQFGWGVGLSYGPIFIGTNDGISALFNKNIQSANAYIGIRIPFGRSSKEDDGPAMSTQDYPVPGV